MADQIFANDKVEHKLNGSKKSYRMRELLKTIASRSPKIRIGQKYSETGDISFSVPRTELGLKFNDFTNWKSEIFSVFFANFLGEFLVRENIDRFAKILTKIDLDQYNEIVNRYEHKKFGMEYSKDHLVFSFHASLLQTILTEDIKKKV